MSKPIDDGGPAFPNNDAHGCAFSGMTLRDYFAGQALAGLCANSGLFAKLAELRAFLLEDMTPKECDVFEHKTISNASHQIADAMLTAREAQQ